MKKLLRDPLLHFLLLGLGLFLLQGMVGTRGSGTGESIVIDEGRIGHLVAGFSRMHQRLPQAGELDALINETIREEILYREAKALGLDQDDTIVRRRLRQKLEFISEDVAPVAEPTDAQLQTFLRSHPDRFRTETRYDFAQVYLDPQRHDQELAEDARALLTQLKQAERAADASRQGDPFLLEHDFHGMPASELARLFGAGFEAALRTLPAGEWQGPVASGYGLHLVLVRGREEARSPELADVREAVRRVWIHARRQQANERFYADLRKRYEVTVERPAASGGATALAAGMRK